MFIEENENGLVYMRSDIIGARHAFTTRYGGVSTGEFASLNFASNRGDVRRRGKRRLRHQPGT